MLFSILLTPTKNAYAATTQVNSYGFVKASGTHLLLNGKKFIPKGINHMDVPTLWSVTSTLPGRSWITNADFVAFKLAGFNSIRLAVKTDYFQSTIPPHNFSNPGFIWLNQIIAMAKKNNVRLILDMHMPTGGDYQDYRIRPESQAFWNDPWAKGRFVDVWREIATRYANEPTIWAYDIMNEPATWDFESYERLMQHTVQAIRSKDNNHLIILQPGMHMSDDFVASFIYPKINDKNLANSIHFYEPIYFTHKDVYWGVTGPNVIALYPSTEWNATRIAQAIDAAALKAHSDNRPAILTEFGTVFHTRLTGQVDWISDTLKAAQASDIGWHYWYYKSSSYIRELGLTIPGNVPRPLTWTVLRKAAQLP